MINTLDIKLQYKNVFYCGTKESKEVILILGSCRAVPYLNYLDQWNKLKGNPYKIHCIDPINYHWDENGKEQSYEDELTRLETDENFLNVLKSVKIFIHEGLSSHSILNTLKKDKNIYQFGMNPEIDINIPNFHDVFILFNDFFAIDKEFQSLCKLEYQFNDGLSNELQGKIVARGELEMRRFLNICAISDFPEMGEYFKNNYLTKRLFWTFNHVSKGFTLEIFRLMNQKFLHLDMNDAYWNDIQHDIYETVRTPLCEYDIINRPFDWNEDVVRFKEHNKI